MPIHPEVACNVFTDSPTVGAAANDDARRGPRQARYKASFAPALVARDDCTGLPKLCTDEAMLNGGMTTLTYLCPDKTAGPSTVTVTTTATTTVTADLPDSTSSSSSADTTESWSVQTTVYDIGPTSLNE